MTTHQSRFDIDWNPFQIRKDGQFINLAPMERSLLRELIQHKNQALSHKHLLQKVWGDSYGDESNYVYIYIAKLRKKLEDDPKNPQNIVTVSGIGYRWIEPDDILLNPTTTAPNSTLAKTPYLPIPLTSFVGREQEIAFLGGLLHKHDVRLLSLTGPGGIGKTRLALELASNFRDAKFFADGVHFIDLVPVDNAELVVSAIAQVFGIREKGDEQLLALLKRYLQDKNALVVLDNLEHVMDSSAQLLEILSAVQGVKFLITSREKLNLYGEHNYDVPTLPWNQADSLKGDALRLFEERAQLANPKFLLTDENIPIIQQVCEQLDGLPLAIELAAVTSNTVSPTVLLERLRQRLNVLIEGQSNLPVRHQTLQAAIDWSFQRLNGKERRLFIALSIFNGGFTLEAAEAICADDTIPHSRIGVNLRLLSNKSLITTQWDENQDELRYTMLGSFREFADGLIEKTQAHSLRKRHTEYYVEILESLTQSPSEQTYTMLTSDLGNFRTALRWAITNRVSEFALRICVSMYGLWLKLGNLKEGQQSFIDALEIPSDEASPLRAHALYCAGVLSDWLGDYRTGQGLYRECLRIYEVLRDDAGTINALVTLGSTLISHGDFGEGHALSEQSLKLAREQNNPVGVALALNNLGMLAIYQGDAETARAIYGEKRVLWEALNNEQGMAWALTGLSWTELLRGEYQAAQTLIDQSMKLHNSGDMIGMALALTCDGWIALYQADFDNAARKLENCLVLCKSLGLLNPSIWPIAAMGLVNLYQGKLAQSQIWLDEALHLCQHLDLPAFTPWVYVALGKLARCEGDTVTAGDYLERGFTLSQKRDNKSVLATALEEFAANFAVQKQTELALQIYGAAHAMRETYNLPLSPLDHIEYNAITSSLKANRTVDWDEYWLKGATLSQDEIKQIIINGLRSPDNLA